MTVYILKMIKLRQHAFTYGKKIACRKLQSIIGKKTSVLSRHTTRLRWRTRSALVYNSGLSLLNGQATMGKLW